MSLTILDSKTLVPAMTGISGTLIQMARIALNWEQARLAKEAGCHKITVGRIERGTEGHFEKTRADIVKALESAGIVFVAADSSAGAGVRWASEKIQTSIIQDKIERQLAKQQRREKSKKAKPTSVEHQATNVKTE